MDTSHETERKHPATKRTVSDDGAIVDPIRGRENWAPIYKKNDLTFQFYAMTYRSPEEYFANREEWQKLSESEENTHFKRLGPVCEVYFTLPSFSRPMSRSEECDIANDVRDAIIALSHLSSDTVPVSKVIFSTEPFSQYSDQPAGTL